MSLSTPPKLPTRNIGHDSVSAIGFGAMGLSAIYANIPADPERMKLLDAVYESGVTFWDTADVYGDNEDLIGRWLQRTGKRNELFISTKVGMYLKDGRISNGDPEYILAAAEKSRKRLGVDQIDLLFLHRPDLKVPIETTVGAMAQLVKEGKVKYIGLSECTSATLHRAAAVHPITAFQVEYSPLTLDIEQEKWGQLKTARELGMTVIAYAPLGRGLLTGKYRSPDAFDETDFRRKVAKFGKANFPNILKLADGLKEIGGRHNATAGQVAIAWVMAQGEDVIPIAGTTKVKSLEENLAALNLKLTPEEIQEVRRVAEKADVVHGDRYPAPLMPVVMADTPPL